MRDPRRFKAPYIPRETIWANAEAVRRKYPRAQQTPVDVVALAEFDLKLPIEVEIGLKEQCSVEAFLLRDFTKLRLDRDAFMDERRQARLRFSVAHELGHFFLHAGFSKALRLPLLMSG
jgi:hypothetical protein